jgi:hypothetical protein
VGGPARQWRMVPYLTILVGLIKHEETWILEDEEKKDDDIISIYDHYSSLANAITGVVEESKENG